MQSSCCTKNALCFTGKANQLTVLSANTLYWLFYGTIFIPECVLQSMQQDRSMARFLEPRAITNNGHP